MTTRTKVIIGIAAGTLAAAAAFGIIVVKKGPFFPTPNCTPPGAPRPTQLRAGARVPPPCPTPGYLPTKKK